MKDIEIVNAAFFPNEMLDLLFKKFVTHVSRSVRGER
jgi:hypothetical protein